MIHHGDRIAALVDGELDHDLRDRMLAHITECVDCRTAVDQQRRLKAAMMAATWPPPSDALLRTLISMSEPGEPTPPTRRPLSPLTGAGPRPTGPPPGSPPRGATWAQRRGSIAGRTAARGPGRGSTGWVTRRRAYAVATGALSITAVAAGLVLAGGEPAQPGPALTPPMDAYNQQHAQTTGQIFGDPAYSVLFGVGLTPTSGATGR